MQQGGRSTTEAHAQLKGTFSKDKHELLFTQFGINYNKEEEVYKRGTILIRMEGYEKTTSDKKAKKTKKADETVAGTEEVK